MTSRSRIILGAITAAHGVRGAVKIKPFTQHSDGLTAYGALSDASGREYKLTITGEAKGQLICTLDGIHDRNAAEALRGTELGIDRSALPDLDEDDEYYIEDLVGLKVTLEDNTAIGTVRAVHNFGAGDIVELQYSDGNTDMLAFTHALFPQTDLKAGTLTHCPPERINAQPPAQEDDA